MLYATISYAAMVVVVGWVGVVVVFCFVPEKASYPAEKTRLRKQFASPNKKSFFVSVDSTHGCSSQNEAFSVYYVKRPRIYQMYKTRTTPSYN